MVVLDPQYGPAASDGDLVTPDLLNGLLRAGLGSLLRNADFGAAERVDADSATFAYWDTTGNADATTPRRLVLEAGEEASQDVHGLLELPGKGERVVVGAVVRLTGAAAVAQVSVDWGTVQTDTLRWTAADMDDTYMLVWGVAVVPGGNAAPTTWKVENVGSGDTVEVLQAVMHYGQRPTGPVGHRAHRGLGWAGSWDGAAWSARAGARLVRVEDLRIGTTAGNTVDSASLDLTTLGPSGLVGSGDTLVAFPTMDTSTALGEVRRLAKLTAAFSGTTLTVKAHSINGVTFNGGTIVAKALVVVVPQPGDVGSRGASRRAYPYG